MTPAKKTTYMLSGIRPYDLHITSHRHGRGGADYSLLLVHGTAGHGGCYDDFAQAISRRRAHVFALDLVGHGLSGGRRGVFTMDDFLEDVDAVAQDIRTETGLPVIVLGASQGGEVAFHSLARSESISAAVCMNILLNAERPMNRKIALFRSGLAGAIGRVFGDALRVPLRWVIDFAAAYEEDPGALATKVKDPTYVWSYGFKSYRSVFSYNPPIRAGENKKPVFIVCGENDPVVGVDHCRRCFEAIGGPKDFFALPGGGHQLMMFHRDFFAELVDGWIRGRVLDADSAAFLPSIDAQTRGYFDFLSAQRATAQQGEAQYQYTLMDRMLTWVANGDTETGVRYFSSGAESEQWRFTSQLVAEIDHKAWEVFIEHLPERSEDRPARMAIVGCGRAGHLPRLLEEHPGLKGWEVVGLDIDARSIAAGKRALVSFENIELRCGDVRDHRSLAEASMDVVYLHGVLDHCHDHRAVIEACHRALRPGGRLMTVVPDRNLYTWLAFVSIGPRWIFKLKRSIHDFRRFPRPGELRRLVTSAGLEMLEIDPENRGHWLGVEYEERFAALSIKRSVASRNVGAIKFEITRPRRWLGGGFLGEYIGVAQRPRPQR